MNPRLPRAERNRQITALWPTHTSGQVAAAMGLSTRHVRGLARRMGLPSKPMGPSRALTHGSRAAYVRLWWGRKTRNEIAAHLGVRPGSLTAAARVLGLPKLRPGRAAEDGPRVVRATASLVNRNGREARQPPPSTPKAWRCGCNDYRLYPGKTTQCPACGTVPGWATNRDERKIS